MVVHPSGTELVVLVAKKERPGGESALERRGSRVPCRSEHGSQPVGEQEDHWLGKRAFVFRKLSQHLQVRLHAGRVRLPRRVSRQECRQLGQLGSEFLGERDVKPLLAFLPVNRKTRAGLIDCGIERLGYQEPAGQPEKREPHTLIISALRGCHNRNRWRRNKHRPAFW